MDDDEGARGAPGDGARARGVGPSTIASARKPPAPSAPDEQVQSATGTSAAAHPLPLDREELGAEISDYQAGCNRRVQVTKRAWNRFDRAKKKIFLKWFAATANAKDSARRAGVGYSTVFDHRMADGQFAEAWDRALDQSYARLEAKVVQMQFDEADGEPIEFDGAFEPPDPPVVDLAMALQLLKQHKAEVTRIRAERAHDPRSRRRKRVPAHERARLASDAEMRRALVKSLRAFGVRVSAADLRAHDPSTIPSSRNGAAGSDHQGDGPLPGAPPPSAGGNEGGARL